MNSSSNQQVTINPVMNFNIGNVTGQASLAQIANAANQGLAKIKAGLF